MNELTIQMQQIMHPRAVLVAYECETAGYSIPRSYLELRPVNEKGRMGAGIPVTYEFMNSLVESYTESMSGIPHGRIPGNMLLCDSRKGRERYIWYSHLGGGRNPTRSNLVSVTEHVRNNPFDYSELQQSGKKLKDILA